MRKQEMQKTEFLIYKLPGKKKGAFVTTENAPPTTGGRVSLGIHR